MTLPAFIERAQHVSLMGVREQLNPPVIGYKWGPRQWWPIWSSPPLNLANVATARRLGVPPVVGGPCPADLHVGRHGPGYSCVPDRFSGALGEDYAPYDLNQPGAVREIKAALAALGKSLADPFKYPTPIIETTWQRLSDDDVWDGPAADSFAIATGRYNKMGWDVGDPWLFDTPSGPQPTAHGLELIAGAVNKQLGGHPRMDKYLAWRGGTFEPPSAWSAPPATAPILQTTNLGPSFLQLPSDVSGIDPALVASVKALDESLRALWKAAVDAQDEATRQFVAVSLEATRVARRETLKKALSQSVVAKQCQNKGWVWIESTASCEEPPTVYVPPLKPPEVTPPATQPGGAGAAVAYGLAAIGVVGAIGWYLTRPSRSQPPADWKIGDLDR